MDLIFSPTTMSIVGGVFSLFSSFPSSLFLIEGYMSLPFRSVTMFIYPFQVLLWLSQKNFGWGRCRRVLLGYLRNLSFKHFVMSSHDIYFECELSKYLISVKGLILNILILSCLGCNEITHQHF